MRELVELTERQAISAAVERVRLSIVGARTQVDVSLPLDVPIAILLPELVKLVRSRESTDSDLADGPFPKEAKRTIWTLIRADGKTPLRPIITLRNTDIADGEILRLTAERALSAPILYDDVVDAAARLNKAGYASWNATAAKWMAFAGVCLTSAVWVYFLVAHALRPNRATLVGLSVVVALSLVGGAALAHRSYGQADIGAALGWAALPIAAAVGWATLSGLGAYAMSAGSAAMVVVCVAVFRAVGTGHWGYLASGVFFGCVAVALVIYATGVPALIVGAGQAVIATLACLSVPLVKARSDHLTGPSSRQREDGMAADPFSSSRESTPKNTAASTSPAALSVWERVRNAALTRSGVYTGLASSTGAGVSVVLLSTTGLRWSSLAFASVCAATLGLYTRLSTSTVERAALAIPATTLALLTCAVAQRGSQPMPLVAFALLLTAIVVSVVIAVTPRAERPRRWSQTALAYVTYLSTAAVIPLALWVADAYGRLGVA